MGLQVCCKVILFSPTRVFGLLREASAQPVPEHPLFEGLSIGRPKSPLFFLRARANRDSSRRESFRRLHTGAFSDRYTVEALVDTSTVNRSITTATAGDACLLSFQDQQPLHGCTSIGFRRLPVLGTPWRSHSVGVGPNHSNIPRGSGSWQPYVDSLVLPLDSRVAAWPRVVHRGRTMGGRMALLTPSSSYASPTLSKGGKAQKAQKP